MKMIQKIQHILTDAEVKILEETGLSVRLEIDKLIGFVNHKKGLSTKSLEYKIDVILISIQEIKGITKDELFNKSRKWKNIQARYIAYLLMREELLMTYSAIGDIFGYDHATIISAIKMIKNHISVYEEYKNLYNEVLNKYKKQLLLYV